MKKLVCLVIFLFFFSVQLASANPPKEIKLSYNRDTKVLTIEIVHITNDLIEHYIRRILIHTDRSEPLTFSFVHQPTSTGLTQEMALDLLAGDTVRVKAICRKAGFKEETLTIP